MMWPLKARKRPGYDFFEITRCPPSRGEMLLLDKVNLTIEEGQRFGLIGRNGTGKVLLLKVLAGVEKLDAGKEKRR